jgi:hypothetical protein
MTRQTWRRRRLVGLAAMLIGGVLGCYSGTTTTSSAPAKPKPERENQSKPPTPPKPDPG